MPQDLSLDKISYVFDLFLYGVRACASGRITLLHAGLEREPLVNVSLDQRREHLVLFKRKLLELAAASDAVGDYFARHIVRVSERKSFDYQVIGEVGSVYVSLCNIN